VRALIVDHEPRVRATLRHLCEGAGTIKDVTVAECGAIALEMIRVSQPDLLFLDVELNDMTGFDVMRSLAPVARPAVIMIAAREDHVVEAFHSGAIDYLTKPIGASRFATAIEKVHERYEWASATAQGRFAPNDSSAIAVDNGRRNSPLRLLAESAHRLYFLAVNDVDYIESCGNYVLIHVGNQKYVRRDTLKRLAPKLREFDFEWIRSSTLVNLARVAYAEKLTRGALAFTLTSGTRLVSKTRIRLESTRGSN
jgi:two-component system LytT family response regulator